MTDIERIWREKSDEDLLEAAANLRDFTEEGQEVIRAELTRRGMEDPVEQAGEAAVTAEAAEEAAVGDSETGRPVLPEPECTRCHTEMRFRGTRTLLGETGNLFANADVFDVYVCPRCGHADLFAAIDSEEAGSDKE